MTTSPEIIAPPFSHMKPISVLKAGCMLGEQWILPLHIVLVCIDYNSSSLGYVAIVSNELYKITTYGGVAFCIQWL